VTTSIIEATVSQIWIYPVKGLGGIALKSCLTTSRGLKHDRRFMVVDSQGLFLTQRDHPVMATVWTEILEDALELSHADYDPILVPLNPALKPTRAVQVWSSTVAAHAVSDEADGWLSEIIGQPVQLVYMPDSSERFCNNSYAKNGEIVSFADGYPVLVTLEESLAELNARIKIREPKHHPLPMNRFRSNIVLKGLPAWSEDNFTNLAIGSAKFKAVKPCGRCQVTTTDQATGLVEGPEPLLTLSSYRQTEVGIIFGMNLVVLADGVVACGDKMAV
jgi:uncharacterized protein